MKKSKIYHTYSYIYCTKHQKCCTFSYTGTYNVCKKMSYNIWTAAADGKLEIVSHLIESGNFSPNIKDENGYTPMHAATSYNRKEVLSYLISKGGNANIQDSDGDTPLHQAETVEIAKILLDEGNADPRTKNSDGKTALETLQEDNEFPELIKFLQGLSSESNDTTTVDQDTIQKTFNGQPIQVYLSRLQDDNSPELLKRREQIQNIMTQDIPEAEKDEKLKKLVLDALTSDVVEGDGNLKKRRL